MIRPPDGSRPTATATAADGRTLCVSSGRVGTVCALDPAAGAVRATVKVGPRPWVLGLSQDGNAVFVANGPPDVVSVVGTWAITELTRVKAGRGPWVVAVVPAPE